MTVAVEVADRHRPAREEVLGRPRADGQLAAIEEEGSVRAEGPYGDVDVPVGVDVPCGDRGAGVVLPEQPEEREGPGPLDRAAGRGRELEDSADGLVVPVFEGCAREHLALSTAQGPAELGPFGRRGPAGANRRDRQLAGLLLDEVDRASQERPGLLPGRRQAEGVLAESDDLAEVIEGGLAVEDQLCAGGGDLADRELREEPGGACVWRGGARVGVRTAHEQTTRPVGDRCAEA